MRSRLHRLAELGQSVWIDDLSRDLILSGALARAVEEDAVVGVTSNPTIFENALSQSDAYDAQLAAHPGGNAKRVFLDLAMRDVSTACDVLRPVWETTEGRDGYVSIEVDPHLADDTDATTRRPRCTTRSPSPTCSSRFRRQAQGSAQLRS
jgi:transaldolase